MNTQKLRKLITAALLAALTCVATFVIHFPTTGGGYIHPGDAFVLLTGIILGPIYGPLSAGIGSLLADLLAGAPQFAIVTLIIKALTALVAAFIYKNGNIKTVILAGILGGVIVTSGYFIFEYFLYGLAGAAKEIIPNIVQNVFGIVLAPLLLPLLLKVPQIKDMMENR